jgi:hypothetical protein
MPGEFTEIVFFIQSNTRGYQVEYGLLGKGIQAELEGIQTVAIAVVRIIERHHVRRSLDHMLMW